MAIGASGLIDPVVYILGVHIVPPSTIDLILIDWTIADGSRTRSAGPHIDIVEPGP